MKLALAAARATAFASRATGRGGGTTLPGRVLTALAPDAPRRLAAAPPARLRRSSPPRTARRRPARCSPRCCAGACSWRATAPAPISPPASPRRSRCARPPSAELGLFECDEAALPAIADQLAPERDRPRQPLPRPARPLRRARARRGALARAGREPRRRRRRSSSPPTTRSRPRSPRAIRPSCATASTIPRSPCAAAPHAADARFCVRCGHAYDYRAVYVGHLSDYACPNCGNARAPLDLAARAIDLRGLDGTAFDLCRGDERVRVELALPGLYNVENALAAAALAVVLGEPLDVIADGLARFRGAFGRFQRLRVGSAELVLLLIKNPAGANEVLRILPARRRHAAVRAQRPHRRRPRRLLGLGRRLGARRPAPAPRRHRGHARRRRGAAAQVRGRRRGGDRGRARRRAARSTARPSWPPAAPATCCPTYTAMLELQRVAASRGLARPYWEEAAA